MPTFAEGIMGIEAIASIDVINGVFFRQRGFASVVRNGGGDVSCTLSQACDLDNFLVMAQQMGGAVGAISVEKVSSTVIRIRAGVDDAVCVMVQQIGPN